MDKHIIKRCVVCNKEYYCKGYRGQSTKRTVRSRLSHTCSKKCSVVYTKVYKYINTRREGQLAKFKYQIECLRKQLKKK